MAKLRITYPIVVQKTIEIDVSDETADIYIKAIQDSKYKFVKLPEDGGFTVIEETPCNVTIVRVQDDTGSSLQKIPASPTE